MDEGADGWGSGVKVSPDEPMEGQSDGRVHGALLHRFRSELVPLFVFALQHHLETKNMHFMS